MHWHVVFIRPFKSNETKTFQTFLQISQKNARHSHQKNTMKFYLDSDHVECHQEKSCKIMRVVEWKIYVVEQAVVMSKLNLVELFRNVLEETTISQKKRQSRRTCGLTTFLSSSSFQTIILIIVHMCLQLSEKKTEYHSLN